MARDDHHDHPFDDGTQTKLFIYKSYLQAWLQVFIHTSRFSGKPLQFFDFFSGPGQDPQGKPGSPLILMDELELNRDLIRERSREIRVVFNDHDGEKSQTLRELCRERKYSWQPTILTKEFEEAYALNGTEIGQGPSLVFLDQYGVKFVTRKIFTEIAQKPQTDILFFFASSHQRRFNEEFSNELHVPADVPYTHAHRVVADQFRQWAPRGYFVGHFSIKKGSNVYGLIFGSGHWLGMFRFLQIAWKVDAQTGEANFPIEADLAQGSLFDGYKKTKLELMDEELTQKITAREFATDGQVALHCVTAGILPTKVTPNVYQKLKKEGVLVHTRESQPRSSQLAITEPRNLVFR